MANVHIGEHLLEPTVPPQYPADPLPDRIRDYFLSRYNGNISPDDAAWLAELVTDFIESNRLINQNDYQPAARKCLRIFSCDRLKHGGSPQGCTPMANDQPSFRPAKHCWTNLTEAALARQCGISKMAVSNQVHKFLASVDMEPCLRHRQISTVQKVYSITKG
jgi:hypothetical protein